MPKYVWLINSDLHGVAWAILGHFRVLAACRDTSAYPQAILKNSIAALTSVPTLVEQIQLISRKSLNIIELQTINRFTLGHY